MYMHVYVDIDRYFGYFFYILSSACLKVGCKERIVYFYRYEEKFDFTYQV